MGVAKRGSNVLSVPEKGFVLMECCDVLRTCKVNHNGGWRLEIDPGKIQGSARRSQCQMGWTRIGSTF